MKKYFASLLSLIVPALLVVTIWSPLKGSQYNFTSIIISILAYGLMVNELYLDSKPKWLDNLIGTRNIYLTRIFMISGALLFGVMHSITSSGYGIVQITGILGVLLLTVIAIIAVPILRKFSKFHKGMTMVFTHKRLVLLQWLNMFAVIVIFIHVTSMSFFSSQIPFYSVFLLATVIATTSFIVHSVKSRSERYQGTVTNISTEADLTKLTIKLAKFKMNHNLEVGNFVSINYLRAKDQNNSYSFMIEECNSGIVSLVSSDERSFEFKDGQSVVIDATHLFVYRKLFNNKMNNLLILSDNNSIDQIITLIKELLHKKEYSKIILLWSTDNSKAQKVILNSLKTNHSDFQFYIKSSEFDQQFISQFTKLDGETMFLISGDDQEVELEKKKIRNLTNINKNKLLTESFSG